MRLDLLLVLGLVNWLVTLVFVESELFAPLRAWAKERKPAPAHLRYVDHQLDLRTWKQKAKLNYLVGCHLCTGVWVGFAMALVLPFRFAGLAGFVGWGLTGLVYKALGHLTLEVVAWLKKPARFLNRA